LVEEKAIKHAGGIFPELNIIKKLYKIQLV